MQLNKAIKFRYLSAQLTVTEHRHFIHKLLDYNTNIINSALFYQILNQSINNSTQSDHINTLVSNIILSRKKKSKPHTTQTIKLDLIPKSLIGVTASFLEQSDYINFSKSNRIIFIGCNSPNLLQQLDLRKIRNYNSINLSSFPSTKKLSFHLKKFDQFPHAYTLPAINELKCIDINENKKGHSNIDIFINQNLINTSTITQLKCSWFGKSDKLFNRHKFIELLTKFPSLQHLHLFFVFVGIDCNQLKQTLPYLKALTVNGGAETRNKQLILALGSQLQSLAFFSNRGGRDYELKNICFGKLKELKLSRPSVKSIDDILKTAVNLRTISVKTTVRGISLMTGDDAKNVFSKLINSCKLLEYIEFIDEGELIESVLDGIYNGLFETKNMKRKQMKMEIVIKECNSVEQDISKLFGLLVLNVVKIINCLKLSNVCDFMIIVVIDRKIEKKTVMNNLKAIVSSDIELKQQGKAIIITNKCCKINGYTEKWTTGNWDLSYYL
eukprot:224950_1